MKNTVAQTARIVMLVLVLGLLAACTAQTQDQVARASAKTVVNSILASRFPGVPTAPVTDCVIDNATSTEIFALAADAVTGPTASTVEIVSRIATRPGTLQCLATNGLPAFLQ